ncbi:phosphonoacetaldehyde hydrolase [Pontibacillus yanchengensis Y32]|uniref:Phosphonoacetaldehyde hydrolase n=1 Tax=Pontibacillus yanchengensis Y32 TaxID=1385514 RepID=A0A0A2TE49_9BACI|nr:phosphonoacetaldehyde hydrolase [Pontibacillus yanchengensis Y32]
MKGVIFDWAGTTVDYGCFAPVQVFMEVFKQRGVEITFEEARAPMGLLKIDHVRAICEMDRVKAEWKTVHGKAPTEQDVVALYEDFEPMLFRILDNYADPLPHVQTTMEALREKQIAIGSTSGYTEEMMNVVAREASNKGYQPDAIVTSTEVPAGRPYPWMCYMNAMKLNVFPMKHMVKVGDTVSDMKEGVHAGMWTVGTILGSSTLGLSQEDVNTMDESLLKEKMASARDTLYEAGADFVIDDISALPELIDQINTHLQEEVSTHV